MSRLTVDSDLFVAWSGGRVRRLGHYRLEYRNRGLLLSPKQQQFDVGGLPRLRARGRCRHQGKGVAACIIIRGGEESVRMSKFTLWLRLGDVRAYTVRGTNLYRPHSGTSIQFYAQLTCKDESSLILCVYEDKTWTAWPFVSLLLIHDIIYVYIRNQTFWSYQKCLICICCMPMLAQVTSEELTLGEPSGEHWIIAKVEETDDAGSVTDARNVCWTASVSATDVSGPTDAKLSASWECKSVHLRFLFLGYDYR